MKEKYECKIDSRSLYFKECYTSSKQISNHIILNPNYIKKYKLIINIFYKIMLIVYQDQYHADLIPSSQYQKPLLAVALK